MSRWKAFAIHLACSILALGGVLAALVWIWYPPPLFAASGVQEFASIFVAVDMVIGPLLTLVIYRHGKRGLSFDLACIGLAQFLAFLYGLNVVRETRPVYFVATEDRITMMTANMLDPADRSSAPPEYRSDPWLWTRLVAVVEPEDAVAFGRRLSRTLNAGYPPEATPEYYEPYENVRPALLARARPAADLARQGGETEALVQQFLARHGRGLESLVVVPFHAPDKTLSAALDSTSGALIGLIDASPPAAESDA